MDVDALSKGSGKGKEKGQRTEDRGQRKEERGKRKEERGKRKKERGKRKKEEGRETKARTTRTTSSAGTVADLATTAETAERRGQKARERVAKGKASRTVLKAATGKKDGQKQERHSHIASKMKSMLMDGGRTTDWQTGSGWWMTAMTANDQTP